MALTIGDQVTVKRNVANRLGIARDAKVDFVWTSGKISLATKKTTGKPSPLMLFDPIEIEECATIQDRSTGTRAPTEG